MTKQWWSDEAWNQQTFNLLSVPGDLIKPPGAVELLLNGPFQQASKHRLATSTDSAYLPPLEFLDRFYAQQGVYDKVGESIFERWLFCYRLQRGDAETPTLKAGVSKLRSSDYYWRSLHYVMRHPWTVEETVQIADLLARAHTPSRNPDGWKKLSQEQMFSSLTATRRTWERFILNPSLPQQPNIPGETYNMFTFLAKEVLGAKKTDPAVFERLQWFLANPNTPAELLEEIVDRIRPARLAPEQRRSIYTSLRNHRNVPASQLDKVKYEDTRYDFYSDEMLLRLAAKPSSLDTDWETLGHYVAHTPGREYVGRMLILLTLKKSRWNTLASLSPMLGAVFAGLEQEMGVEPLTIPLEWLLETS